MTLDFTTLGKPKTAPGGEGKTPDTPIAVTAQTIQKLIQESAQKLVVLYAYSAGSPTESAVSKVFAETLRPEIPVVYASLDVLKNQLVVQQLGLKQFPAVLVLIQQQVVGVLPANETPARVKDFIMQSFGPNAIVDDTDAAGDAADGIEEALTSADEAREAGNITDAVEIYSAILGEDPTHVRALAGLARCQITAGNFEQAEMILGMAPPEAATDTDIEGARAALELARQGSAAAGKIDELRARVATNPKDHEARYELGIALAATDDRKAALDELLGLMKTDRTWNDDAARRQLVTFFEAWGPKDPMTIEGRRRMSSLLFS